MKKLLIFMLVLGMASSASAVLNPSWLTEVNGTPWTGPAVVDVEVSDIVKVTLHEGSTTTVTGGLTALGMNVDHADYRAGTLGPDQTFLLWNIAVEGASDGVDGFNNIVGLTNPTAGFTDFDVLHFEFDVPTDLVIGSFITLSVYQGAYYGASGPATVPSLTMEVIPEPMTIALLGLGSLFLLRRRK